MSCSKPKRAYMPARLIPSALCLVLLSACTVEPLNSSQPDTSVSAYSSSVSTRAILASTNVDPVNTRVAQQVRNNLLFAMNGGQIQPDSKYGVRLSITSRTATLSIENSSLSPTSAKVLVNGTYTLTDIKSGKLVAKGTRKSFAGFDRTPQSFANERAERDAENRAAKEVARQIYLALAQSIADL